MAIGALRSDLTDRFQTHPEISASTLSSSEVLKYETFTLDQMPCDLFREIILGPANRVGLVVPQDLVEQMIADVGTSDALPLLQYIFQQMWLDKDCTGSSFFCLFTNRRISDRTQCNFALLRYSLRGDTIADINHTGIYLLMRKCDQHPYQILLPCSLQNIRCICTLTFVLVNYFCNLINA